MIKENITLPMKFHVNFKILVFDVLMYEILFLLYFILDKAFEKTYGISLTIIFQIAVIFFLFRLKDAYLILTSKNIELKTSKVRSINFDDIDSYKLVKGIDPYTLQLKIYLKKGRPIGAFFMGHFTPDSGLPSGVKQREFVKETLDFVFKNAGIQPK